MKLSKKWARQIALALILLSSAIPIFWGFSLARTANGGSLGFQAIYYGTRCLLQHRNPYRQSELESVYRADGGEHPSDTFQARQSVTLYVNLPTTFILTAPLAVLPWGTAQAIWLTLLAGVFVLAGFMAWELGASSAPGISLFLVCLLMANAEVIFGAGNTAGLVISLCVIAVSCFFKNRFVPAGIVCLAVSLAIKPHDAGLVWLFFLLAGGIYRKRALQALLVTAVVGLSAFLWISYVAPHWVTDWRSNLAMIAAPGGINEPGPTSLTGRTPDMVIDLQAAVSVFRDDPHFYNAASYLFCGALILVWSARTLRSGFSQAGARLALAAIVPLTLLVTYHRPYDAKLVLLTIPACAMLWAEGGLIGWIAVMVSTAGVVFTGDIPLAISVIIAENMHLGTASTLAKIVTVVLLRPATLVLLALGVFYLCVYLGRPTSDKEDSIDREVA